MGVVFCASRITDVLTELCMDQQTWILKYYFRQKAQNQNILQRKNSITPKDLFNSQISI